MHAAQDDGPGPCNAFIRKDGSIERESALYIWGVLGTKWLNVDPGVSIGPAEQVQ